MKRMEVVFLVKYLPPWIGGLPIYYYNLMLHLSGLKATVLTSPLDNYELYDRVLIDKGVTVVRAHFYPHLLSIQLSIEWISRLFFFISTVVRLLLTRQVDYLVAGNAAIYTALVAYIVKILFGKPYILFFHGEEIPGIPLKSNFILRFFCRAADSIFCNSQFTSEKLLQFMGPYTKCHKKVYIITPGVEDRFFVEVAKDKVNERKRKLGIIGKRVIYTIARLDERKGHDIVIEALPYVLEKHKDVVYLIGGKGPRLEYLQSLVQAKGLENCVKFLGLIPDSELCEYHHVGEIYIMANRTLRNGDTEGFGIVFLEANATGNPVVGGKSGGAINAIVDGKTGLLVDSEDPQDIADKICLLLENKDRARDMGEKGRERAWTEFRWQYVGKRFEETLLSMRKTGD